jgi:glycosyltransferase domain-containing protein
MDMLSELTVIIPTYNRHPFISRSIAFWKNKRATVCILDGSKDPVDRQLQADFPSNISYYHLPVGIVERLKFACSLIKTDYVILQGDDEFFSHSALQRCIQELKSDIELVSCGGVAMGFSFDRSNNRVSGHQVYPELLGRQIQEDSPCERMFRHMSNYSPSSIYSVVKSKVWIDAIQPFLNNEMTLFAIGELQFELGICYYGKSKIIPQLTWFRSNENANIRGTDKSLDDTKQIDVWWHDKSKTTEHEDFLNAMSAFLTRDKKNDIEHIKACLCKAIDAYANAVKSRKRKNKIESIWALMYDVLLFRKFFPPTENEGVWLPSFYEFSLAMSANGVMVAKEDIEEIELSIRSFHQNKTKS